MDYQLIKLAAEWIEQQEEIIRLHGQGLDGAQYTIAQRVGVTHPERIFIKEVDEILLPDDPYLRQVAQELNFLGPNSIGLTLGYGVYLKRGYVNTRLLSHEFRHVKQYEDAGSIHAFIAEYLQQIFTYGYRDSPLEIDARQAELSD